MNPEPNTQWRLETKYLVSIGLAIFALFVIYLMRPVLPLLVLASLIALVASPSIHFLTRRLKIPGEAAVAITYLLASILILIILFILLPQIVSAVNFVVNLDYAKLVDNIRLWVETALIQLRDNDLRILGVTIVMDQIVDPILRAIQNDTPLAPPEPTSLTALFSSLGQALTRSVGLVLGVAGSIGTAVASFILMILASIYLSQDAYKIRDLIVNNLPPAYQPEIDSLLFRLRNTWNNFLKGQVVLMVFIGVFVWLGAIDPGAAGCTRIGDPRRDSGVAPQPGPNPGDHPGHSYRPDPGIHSFCAQQLGLYPHRDRFLRCSPADRECGDRAQADEQGGQASPAGGDPGVFRGSVVLRHPGCDPGNPGDCLGEGDRQVPVLENPGSSGGSGASSTAFHLWLTADPDHQHRKRRLRWRSNWKLPSRNQADAKT